MNLYELTTDLARLESALEPDEQGEIHVDDIDLESYLNLKDATVEKVANVVKFIRNLETHADSLDSEAKRLTARKRACANLIDRIKGYALYCMQANGLKVIGDKPFSLTRNRNSAPSVIVPDNTDLSTWEDRFKVVKVEPNKREIAAAWKADEPIPGNVEIVELEHVRIR